MALLADGVQYVADLYMFTCAESLQKCELRFVEHRSAPRQNVREGHLEAVPTRRSGPSHPRLVRVGPHATGCAC